MQSSRQQFLILATSFQGSLAVSGLALGWFVGINPLLQMEMTPKAAGLGIAAAIPMLMLFAVTYRFPVGPLKTIKQFLVDALGPPLAECRSYDMAWVAFLAGFSEELMFRGVIQTWLTPAGWIVGLLASNALFGLAHAVTPTYAVLAGLMGVYLGLIYEFAGHNLTVPVVTHSVYDLAAFFVVRHSFCLQRRSSESSQINPPDP